MDYEKKYNEALERAKDYFKANQKIGESEENDVLSDIFPELKESEDELTWLKKYIEEEAYFLSMDISDNEDRIKLKNLQRSLTWLEKQAEQKPTTIDIDKMVDDYANNKERGNEEFGKPVNCMIRAYRQGLNDAIGKVVLKPLSEEDERMFNHIIGYLHSGDDFQTGIDWLKSLKERIGG